MWWGKKSNKMLLTSWLNMVRKSWSGLGAGRAATPSGGRFTISLVWPSYHVHPPLYSVLPFFFSFVSYFEPFYYGWRRQWKSTTWTIKNQEISIFILYFQAGQVSDNNVKQRRMRKLLSCDSAFCTLRQVSKEKCQTKQAALSFVLQNATSWKFQYYHSNNGGEIITVPRPFPSSFY